MRTSRVETNLFYLFVVVVLHLITIVRFHVRFIHEENVRGVLFGSYATFRLHVGREVHRLVEPNDEIALRNIQTFLDDSCGNENVDLGRAEFLDRLALEENHVLLERTR